MADRAVQRREQQQGVMALLQRVERTHTVCGRDLGGAGDGDGDGLGANAHISPRPS